MSNKTFEIVLDPPLRESGTSYVQIIIDKKTDEESLKWFCDHVKDHVAAVYDLNDDDIRKYFGDIFDEPVKPSE